MPATALLAALKSSRKVTPENVLELRRIIYADGGISLAEVDLLFQVNETVGADCQDWRWFFIEAVTDHLIHQVEPIGFISEDTAKWLMERISRDGVVESATELELLVKLLESARAAPAPLAEMALRSVQHAVVSGTGATRDGRVATAGSIDAAEVALLRRVLHASASACGTAISRDEANVLFAIDRATANGANDPAWPDLFARAIANHLLSASIHAVPDASTALARARWLEAPKAGFGDMIGGLLAGFVPSRRASGALHSVLSAPGEDGFARDNAKDAATLAAAAEMTSDEVAWLVDRLGEDHRITSAEQALLSLLQAERGTRHPRIDDLVARLEKRAAAA
jgi:hypothetical protein